MKSFKEEATKQSTACFFNSFLKEANYAQVVKKENAAHLSIPLSGEQSIVLPLEKHSSLGRHRYNGEIFLRTEAETVPLSFERAVEILLHFKATDFQAQPGQLRIFTKRVIESRNNIERSLGTRTFPPSLDFKSAEQGLWVGHPFHPSPKSRDEFAPRDEAHYSPEFGGSFALKWYQGSREIVHQRSASNFNFPEWTKKLAEQEIDGLGSDPDAVLFPMHPWQAEKISNHPVIQAYLQSGKLVPLSSKLVLWHPTSSVRSVYRADSPFMLKFSMTVRLTNSIRHLLPKEVERSLQLKEVLGTALGKEFLGKYPTLKIISEPAYLCLVDEKQEPLPETMVVCRENPFQKENSQGKVVLATLVQDGLMGEASLLSQVLQSMVSVENLNEKVKVWFALYLERIVKPLILAHANYGIVLGAHQQNLIIDLKEGLPQGAYFRDCQGTGYTELGFANFSPLVSLLNRANGNIVSEKMGNVLFSYYLILNSTFGVVTALSDCAQVTENDFISELAYFLKALLAEGVKDDSCLRYLLESEVLMHKGNFSCSFTNLNENTTQDPLEIYRRVLNPIALVHH